MKICSVMGNSKDSKEGEENRHYCIKNEKVCATLFKEELMIAISGSLSLFEEGGGKFRT